MVLVSEGMGGVTFLVVVFGGIHFRFSISDLRLEKDRLLLKQSQIQNRKSQINRAAISFHPSMIPDRYQRQRILPAIGSAGQDKIRAARVLLIGCGGLGCSSADLLVRAGVGSITIVDRDVVELSNLQRQSLFDESDARRSLPKVEAAARRLRAVNSEVAIDPQALDVDAGNLLSLMDSSRATIVIDGTDNAQVRYLMNDACVSRGLPWVMAGCVGTEGRVLPVVPGGPCLRCVFPTPPDAGEVDTCDIAGVLGPGIAMVAALQVAWAIRILVDGFSIAPKLTAMEFWNSDLRTIDLDDAKSADCPCCGQRQFEFLARAGSAGAKLCGRNAVQVRPAPGSRRLDLAAMESKLRPFATTESSELMLKLVLHEKPELAMTLFADGRMIVFGSEDPTLARSIYSRVVGD
jgi:molybdopterin-synthase adenylyltransferase